MALTPLKLPRLQANRAIVDGNGKPLPYFLRLMNIDVFQAIEANESNQQLVLDQLAVQQKQLASQLDLINQALELAGLAGGGYSANSIEDITYTDWTLGPVVDLTGVTAGDLTISGTNLQPISTTRMNRWPDFQDGYIRIVEIVGITETVVYGPSVFQTIRDENPNSIPSIANPPDISTFTTPRTSTGAVSYRLDAIMDAGNLLQMFDVRFNIQVKRS